MTRCPWRRWPTQPGSCPASWITKDGLDVTDDFVRYAAPLIGDGDPVIPREKGLQRFARFDVRFIDRKLPAYVPVRFRKA